MSEATTSRRARLRAETADEIKATALKALTTGGAAAISLRAIARDMGMTAGAIYSYFDTRDALITALMVDIHNSLADAETVALEGVPADDPGARLQAIALAYREWAVGNAEEFRLIYGDAVPGYEVPSEGPAREAAHRACALLTDIVALGWPAAAAAQQVNSASWSDFDPTLARLVQQSHPGLPPEAVAVSIQIWGRLHGMVTLEIYGQLSNLTVDPGKLYGNDVTALTRSLAW
ncbi:TetR/AcrR family transcriptional regulator [Kribbella qitaiheensis]|uniref:TetR/AcrR family transcriptional regulator n=1 Tax=Kribbella qitaiheensis TaxID=1544730 RepID=A0A7G6WUV6_9ACTN|nr:TetR/AcrR family transcriptional regulator [Kribbella qitaiheensis]QNE17771.1 TetR/AcrR family transcriptional regulator [Kribbella qitaiheensis]